MKVALVYDRVNKWGGAERVLLALHKIFPKADLYTSVYNKKRASWAKFFNVKTSFLQNFPFAKTAHEFYAPLMPLAFESFNFDNYNLVISITSESAKGIITKPHTRHICYCLTPTRYLWSGYQSYFKSSILKVLAKPLVAGLRSWDRIAAQRPDEYIAISEDVKKRIQKFYKRSSKVIFPPLMLSNVVPEEPKDKDYYLIVSRLVPYKKIDIAVKVFNELSLPLKIVGKGWEEAYLKSIAGKNIEFLKDLEDGQLYGYYKNAKALIFPGVEDFGLTMVEAQYFGTPVLALRGGGALDIVKENVTGAFFNEQTKDSLKNALEKFDRRLYNEKACRQNAKRFSFERFESNLKTILNKL